jgi:hypothetical protein
MYGDGMEDGSINQAQRGSERDRVRDETRQDEIFHASVGMLRLKLRKCYVRRTGDLAGPRMHNSHGTSHATLSFEDYL